LPSREYSRSPPTAPSLSSSSNQPTASTPSSSSSSATSSPGARALPVRQLQREQRLDGDRLPRAQPAALDRSDGTRPAQGALRADPASPATRAARDHQNLASSRHIDRHTLTADSTGRHETSLRSRRDSAGNAGGAIAMDETEQRRGGRPDRWVEARAVARTMISRPLSCDEIRSCARARSGPASLLHLPRCNSAATFGALLAEAAADRPSRKSRTRPGSRSLVEACVSGALRRRQPEAAGPGAD
jgi:hypothetical protein